MKNKFSKFINLQGKYLTSLLFVLFFAVGQMWGADPTYSSYDWNSDQADAVVGTHGSVVIGGALGSKGHVSGHYYLPISNNLKNSENPWNGYMSIASNAGAIDSIKIFYCPNGTNATSVAWATWGSGVTPTQKTLSHGVTAGTKSSKAWASAVWEKIDLTANSVYTVYLSRSIREFQDKDGNSIANFGGGQTINVLGIQVWLHPDCTEPATALSLSSNAAATIYAGDEITFSTSGGNGGSITIAGAASETISANKWTATAGEHTFTASQPKTDGKCAQESELVLNVLSASPVSEVTVAGAANGYKNNKVILTATAANATQYEWYVDGTKQGSDSAKLHFTPTEVKTYSIVCKAKNSFNSEWIASSAHSLTVTSLYGELIRATLTGGNNATMTGIIGGTFDSNLGSGKYKLDKNVYMGVQLASGSFQEGDTVIVSMTTAGSNYPCLFADKERNTLLYLATETSSALVYKMVLPAAANNKNTVYLSRDNDVTYKWNPVVAYISVVRPMPVKSTAYDLTAVKINGTPISAEDLATLKTADAYLLDLATEYPEGPTVKFARQTTNTYEDDSQKVINDTITVTATEVSSKWQAQATISTITYTVKMAKSAATAKVYYYDGATKLGEEIVAINANPTDADDYDDKTLASFVGWYNNEDLAEEHKIANIAALVVTKDTTVYGKWNYQYAASANIEQWVLTNGTSYNAVAQLGTLHYASNITNSLDSLNDDPSKTNRNYAYLGLKIKAGGKMLDFRLANGQTVKVKFGATGNYPQVQINKTGDYAAMSLTDNVWTYTAEGADAYISIKTPNNNTVIIKQIMVNEDLQTVTLPWRVTYNANGGTCATAEAIWSGAALILPDVTPADADHTFAGWYDEVSGGELQGVAGASYTPTDNETLFAHFAPVEYAVAYDGNGATSGSMSASAAGWGTLVTPAVNAFEKTGNIFAGWVITKTSDGSATGITFSEGKFEMPKYDVTLVAQWEDVSKVAVVVETSAKYETLAAAIAAAEAGQTIQLLQNIEQENGVAIAKNLTLDLNGKTYTCTSGSNVNSRAIKITAGNVTIQNGSIIAVPTANFEGGCYGPIRIEGATANVTLEDLTLRNGRHYGLGIKLVEGYLRMEDCTVISENGGGGLEVGEATADVINCTFTQTGLDNAHAWISTCLATCDNGVLNVQGGTYTSEHYSMYVYTSGGEMNVESGSFTGDVVNQVTLSSYPDAVGTINISGGSFEGVGEEPIHFTVDNSGATSIAISGGTFDAPVANEYCAPGYVPSAADPVTGKYTVEPKDGVEIIGVVVTGNTTGDVSGLYQGTATVNLNSKKLDSGKYIYVTLKEGYTFKENDVLIVDVNAKSNLDGGNKALEITTGVGNIDGDVWKSIAFDDYSTGENIISLEGIADGQTSIGLKRSANQNAKINGLRVLRPMKPMLTAITIDGRDGVIDEANKTVAVQIPYEANLAALTVVPTIVWNAPAAENSIVVNGGAAWALGANTYKLTDKDNDYTVYTITLTRDVQKHTVSFNTHGGSAVASVEVEHGAYLTAAPTAPTKEDYIFQYWSLTEDGAEVDVTTVQIDEDKEFHAVWASDGAIKLINKTTGAVNEDGYFITGATATEANSEKAAAWGGTQGTSISGVNALGKIVQYNANTNQTKIKIKVYNTNNSDKYVYIHKIIEGKTTEESVETLTATSKTVVESDYYEFNDTKNRSFYLTTNSTDVKILQVKVIDDGATPMKQAGEAGYSLNLNKGRVVYYANADIAFEGLALNSASNYSVISSTEFQTTKNFSFSISTPVLLKVTTNTAKYYVSQDPDEDGTTATAVTDAGTAEFNLTTTGTWYLVPSTTSNVKYTNIAFELPKAATPVIETQPATNHTFDPGDMTATVVATVTEGTLHYQWYKKATVGDDEEVGTDAATLTTTTEGTYYVVVTNTLAGHQDVSVTSEEAELGYRVTNDATLMALSYGGTAITLEDGVYNYNVELAKGTTDVPALAATATMDGHATVTISNAAEFVSYAATSTVTVKSEDLTVTNVYTVNFTVKHDLPQVDVTATTTWDITNVSANAIELSGSDKNARLLLANIDGVNNNASFNSQALMFEGQHIGRTGAGIKHLAGRYVQFNVTVPGAVFVTFESNGNNARTISINGKKCARTTSGTAADDYITYALAVEPGSVEIIGYEGESANQYVRISKIEFKAEADYQRTVNPSYLGTLCWTNNAVLGGATLYEFAGKNENNYLVFDEVDENIIEAGKPYIFMPENGNTQIKVFNTDNDDPLTTDQDPVNNMYGTITGKTLVPGQDDNMYYFSASHIWAVKDFTVDINIPAYYCYVDYQAVLASEPAAAPAPGRRRVTMGVQGEQVATGMEQITNDQLPIKVLINGQLFILRGEKMFNANGQLVK